MPLPQLVFPSLPQGATEEVLLQAFEGSRDAKALMTRILCSASTVGHLPLVHLAISAGASVEDGEYRAFRFACEYGHLEVAEVLCSAYGAPVEAQDNYAIGLACQNGHLGVARWLVAQGGVSILKADDYYALSYAARKGHTDVVEWILSLVGGEVWEGADGRASPPLYGTTSGDGDDDDDGSASPLPADHISIRFAAGNGHSEIVQSLVRRGACVDVAYQEAVQGGHVALCQWLEGTEALTPLLCAGGRSYLSTCGVGSVSFKEYMQSFRVMDAVLEGFDVVSDVGRHWRVCRHCKRNAHAQVHRTGPGGDGMPALPTPAAVAKEMEREVERREQTHPPAHPSTPPISNSVQSRPLYPGPESGDEATSRQEVHVVLQRVQQVVGVPNT